MDPLIALEEAQFPMTTEVPTAKVLAEIDAAQLAFRDAFVRRDLAAYAALLAPELKFNSTRGRVLTHDGLLRDVKRQFDRLIAFDSEFKRQEAILLGSNVVVTGTQTAQIALRVLAIFAVRWKVERTGRYVWTPAENGWRLKEINIQQERVTRTGFGLASRMCPN